MKGRKGSRGFGCLKREDPYNSSRSEGFWDPVEEKDDVIFQLIKFLLMILLGALAVGSVGQVLAAETCLPSHGVILIYHHISEETPPSTSISPDVFEQHLEYLATNGFRVWDLPTMIQGIREGQDLPDSVVVLTFDDGYESVYTEAFPRLKQRGWPFTVFVCPSALSNRPGGQVSWDQLREMAAAGATVASHGLHHGFMNRPLPGEEPSVHLQRLEKELIQAQERLQEEGFLSADVLAYPYGEYSPVVQDLVKTLGWAAVGQQSGPVGPHSDWTCLPRFPMVAGFAALESFGEKVSSLPLPTFETIKVDPNLALEEATTEAPRLIIKLDRSCLDSAEPTAFASGQGPIPVLWLDRDAGSLEIQAPNPLPRGRSRYNLTVRVPGTRRYYWISQVWIVGQEHKH